MRSAPRAVRKQLAGLMSRWTMRAACGRAGRTSPSPEEKKKRTRAGDVEAVQTVDDLDGVVPDLGLAQEPPRLARALDNSRQIAAVAKVEDHDELAAALDERFEERADVPVADRRQNADLGQRVGDLAVLEPRDIDALHGVNLPVAHAPALVDRAEAALPEPITTHGFCLSGAGVGSPKHAPVQDLKVLERHISGRTCGLGSRGRHSAGPVPGQGDGWVARQRRGFAA